MLLKTLIRLQPPVDEELYSSDSGRRHFLTWDVFTRIPALFRTSTDLEVDKVVAAFSPLLLFKDQWTVKDNKSCPPTNWRVVGGGGLY